MFLAIVVAPTLLSVGYFGLIASDVYVSEAQFVIRSPKSQTANIGIGALLQGAGFSRSADDTHTVHAYLRSRDALSALNNGGEVKNHYTSGDIDLFSRFNTILRGDSIEEFYEYFKGKIVIDLDSASSISTLKVKAFTPDQAQNFNARLLELGERLINQLNARGRQDLVGYAQEELVAAEKRVADAGRELNTYRIKNNIYDVKAQAQLQNQLITKLQDELISTKTQLAQVQAVTPNNPQIVALKAREKIVQTQIQEEMAKFLGGGSSLSNKSSQYELLTLESKLADQKLAAAVVSLDAANAEAQKKQLYLERIVEPNKPDAPQEPLRWHNILSTCVISLMSYWMLKLFSSSIKEHQD